MEHPSAHKKDVISGMLINLSSDGHKFSGELKTRSGVSTFLCSKSDWMALNDYLECDVLLEGMANWKRTKIKEWEMTIFHADAYKLMENTSVA